MDGRLDDLVMVFSLFTADMVGLIAFGVAFGMYITRDSAAARVPSTPRSAGKRSSKR